MAICYFFLKYLSINCDKFSSHKKNDVINFIFYYRLIFYLNFKKMFYKNKAIKLKCIKIWNELLKF